MLVMRALGCASRVAVVTLIVMLGCAQTAHSVFHATDAAFTPKPGPTPRVYVDSNRTEVPRAKIRSVGVIEITVPKKDGVKRAIEVAAEKGRELGCWMLIEHSTFETLQSRASLEFGASITLVHGPVSAPPNMRGPNSKLTAKFNCVVPESESTRM